MAMQQWKLPKSLREISGLALSADERLFAVTDETAIVFELDYVRGRVARSFPVGRPPLIGDFEGVAVWDDALYLITSQGILIRSVIDVPEGKAAGYQSFDTGLQSICEVEGLAANRATGHLMIACKTMHAKADADVAVIYFWQPANQKLDVDRTLRLSKLDIGELIGKKKFNPSAVAVLPDESGFMLLAARQNARVSFDWQGRAVAAKRLSGDHRQSEGLAITADGRVIIADEAGGKGKARLAVYPNGHE